MNEPEPSPIRRIDRDRYDALLASIDSRVALFDLGGSPIVDAVSLDAPQPDQAEPAIQFPVTIEFLRTSRVEMRLGAICFRMAVYDIMELAPTGLEAEGTMREDNTVQGAPLTWRLNQPILALPDYDGPLGVISSGFFSLRDAHNSFDQEFYR